MSTKEPIKDPKGGLTAAGRAHFKRKEGANLKPGVKGAADTPEKMRRKGSFLTRFFTNPSGPMQDEKGKPTRLALSAAAWGEPVPKSRSDAAKLAAKGRRLLERYEKVKKHGDHDQKTHGRRKNATGGTTSERVKELVRNAGKSASQLKKMAKDGGFTYNPKSNKMRTSGYVSAISKEYEDDTPVEEFTVDTIRSYADKFASVLAKEGHHLGAWRETVDGVDKIFLDVSVVVPTVEQAADLGREHDQLGIYHLDTFTQWDRYTNPEGKKVYMPMKPYMEGMYEMAKADEGKGVMFVPGDMLDNSAMAKIVSMLVGDKKEK